MLSYRDIASMLGHAKYTTMWEQWQIEKGYIQQTREESARDFYSRKMTPVYISALEERYNCKLGKLEVGIAHNHASVQACAVLEQGNLPTGDATHLFIKQMSNEGWMGTYGQSQEPFLPVDAIRASLVRSGFQTNAVAMFLIIGNGDRENFVPIPDSNEITDAVVETIEKYRDFLDRDEEPPPDYVLDGKALMAMAGATDRNLPAYNADEDLEFQQKFQQYEEIRAQQSAIGKQDRELKKTRDFLSGYIATKLRGHSRAHVGTKVITIRNVTRNNPARIDEYSQIDVKG